MCALLSGVKCHAALPSSRHPLRRKNRAKIMREPTDKLIIEGNIDLMLTEAAPEVTTRDLKSTVSRARISVCLAAMRCAVRTELQRGKDHVRNIGRPGHPVCRRCDLPGDHSAPRLRRCAAKRRRRLETRPEKLCGVPPDRDRPRRLRGCPMPGCGSAWCYRTNHERSPLCAPTGHSQYDVNASGMSKRSRQRAITTASSNAMWAPCARNGSVGCAASPIRQTRP
jgi:hypothetical protein